MTWSIIARDAESGALGVAVASRFFAVGALIPRVAAQVGAVASQSFLNPLFGPMAIEQLALGLRSDEIIAALRDRDPGIERRQVHLIDASGETASFTGTECMDWCGCVSQRHVSVCGNMLTGAQVVDATLEFYLTHQNLTFSERLIGAMLAGDAQGGDKRGRQSASLLICEDQPYPKLDLRVDDHPTPLLELQRLNAVAEERFLIIAKSFPTLQNPAGILDRREIDAEIAVIDDEIKTGIRQSKSLAR